MGDQSQLEIHGVSLTTVLRLNAERTVPLARYEEDGAHDRFGYLWNLAQDHGVPFDDLLEILSYMPPEEDFDGLVTTLEDYAGVF